jgi:hypothetical protein
MRVDESDRLNEDLGTSSVGVNLCLLTAANYRFASVQSNNPKWSEVQPKVHSYPKLG